MLLAFWPRRHWWMPGRYGHVSIFDRHDDDPPTWVLIEVARGGVEITPVWRAGELDDVLSTLSRECTIVRFERRQMPAFLSPLTCVSFARHYSGVPSRALFPDGLLRDLLRNGAEVIHEAKGSPGIERAAAKPHPG